MKYFDTVIIGAGLAGLQCAKRLSSEGVSVLLVDRKTDLGKGIHTTGIFVRKTIEDFAFPPGTLGKPISNVTLYSPGLKPLEMKSEKEEFRVGNMGVLYAKLLEECVEKGVVFMPGTRFVAVVNSEGRREPGDGKQETGDRKQEAGSRRQVNDTVSTESGSDRKNGIITYISANDLRSRGTLKGIGTGCAPVNSANRPSVSSQLTQTILLEKQGRSIKIKTKVLVGADGVNSRVAGCLGLDQNSEWIVGYEEVYRGVPLKGAARLDCFLDAELAPGYLAWITNDGNESHVGVGGYPSGFNPRDALNTFRNEIAPKFVDIEKGELTETRGGRIPVGGVLKRIANINGLLIGDAAGAVSPLTAGGLDPCMRLSGFAADTILERIRTDDPGVLLKYSGKMFRAKFTTRLLMRRALRLLSYQPLLELGFIFLKGKIGRRAAEKIFFRRGSFPDIDLSAGCFAKSFDKPSSLYSDS